MKENNTRLNAIIKNIVSKVVEDEEHGWPPGCATLLYQPKRPLHENEKAKGKD